MDAKNPVAARACLDCGIDISERNGHAKRCAPCAINKGVKASIDRYRADPKAMQEVTYKARKKWVKNNPEKYLESIRKKNARAIETLSDHYVRQQLNINSSQCPPELIEMKRQQLMSFRALRELTSTLKELTSEK